MLIAFTRAVSPTLGECELTHLPREHVDPTLARHQHDAFERRLSEAGCAVQRLPADETMPDSVFVEDMVVVFDELAVIARPGAESRRVETPAVVEALRSHRLLAPIAAPATLDGGDVLVVGRQVFVGCSSRTSEAGVDQMRRLLGNVVIYPDAYPRTRRLLEARGLDVRVVDVSELAKAEGGVTCCSVIFESGGRKDGR